jgi:hypothetical protein
MHDARVGRWSLLGIAAAGVTVVVLAVSDDANAPPAAAIAGLALLGAGAALHVGRSLLVGVVLSIPGAALIGFAGDLDRPDWIAAAAAVTIAVAAPLLVAAEKAWARSPGVPVAFAVSAVGLYGCVPDTEEARVLLGVALVAALLSLIPSMHSFGIVGAAMSSGLFVWIAAFDAPGRPSAFVGATAALALLLTDAIGSRLRGARPPMARGHAGGVVALAGHTVLAAYASRVAGLEQSVGSAVALAVPALMAALALSVVTAPTTPRRT